MCTNGFIGMMFTVDLYGNLGFDSRTFNIGSQLHEKSVL